MTSSIGSAISLLEVDDLTVSYHGLKALSGATLRVREGEICGLIGPNGSGKTTMLNAICGFVRGSGRITLAGTSIGNLPVHRRSSLGLSRTFQGLSVFPDLSILENVLTGLHLHDRLTFWRSCVPGLRRRIMLENNGRATHALTALGLPVSDDTPAGTLSFGSQRMLDLIRATIAGPKILLLDEPAAGLNPPEVQKLAETIRALRQEGMTILLVEHHLKFVMGLCDRITVLNYGKTIAEGTTSEIQGNPAVIEAYLGPNYDAA